MLLSIVGFAALVILGGFLTSVYGLMFCNTMGEYNIGGVPNTWGDRIFTIILGIILGCYWWFIVYGHSPFSFTLNVK
jgi:hypothetical protein